MPTAPRTTDELYQALRDNEQRPYGRTRTVTAEELAEAAEQFDEPLALVRALFSLHGAYVYGSEPRKSPVAFARLLSLFDEQPDVFDERMRHSLFWRFKWVANALRQVPEMPLASIHQWLAEMRDRYQKAGHGLQPYYGQMYQLIAHTGQDSTLAYELWAARPRTPLSDCEACETCERAHYHLDQGDDGRALEIWEPVLAGESSCQEEPARSISHALLPLLRSGHADRARELHLTGYRSCRRNPSMSGEVGRHLEFCALTGNEARGLELLAENRGLFDEVDSPRDVLDFLTGVEVLLQRVEALGHGELPAAGYAGRTWSVTALRTEVRDRADDLAARFDARNGTTAHADRRRTRLERPPLLDALELTLRTRALDEMAPPAPAPAAAPASRTSAAVPDDLPGLILRARALDEEAHPDALACWARLRTLLADPGYAHPDDPAVGPLAQLRADVLTDEASRAHGKDEYAVAADRYAQAVALYEEAGEAGHAAFARCCALLAEAEQRTEDAGGRAGARGPEAGGPEAGGPEAGGGAPGGTAEPQPAAAEPATDERDGTRPDAAERDETAVEARAAALTRAHAAIVRIQQDTPDLAPYQEARLLRLRATALALRLQISTREEHADPALAEADLLQAFATRHGIAGQVSGARFLRAGAYAIRGDLPTAVTEADGLLDMLREHGPAWHLPRALDLRARLRFGLGEAEAAYADLTEAVRLAAAWPPQAVHAALLHGHLAHMCLRLGRFDEALRHLTRSAELNLRDGDRTDALCAFSEAARISLDLGRIEDTIALLDSLLAEPGAGEGMVDDRLLAQLRLTRARALRAGEDRKAATAEFLALAAESAGWDDDQGSHAMIAGETAVLLGEAGEFERARQAADQALAAHARSPRYEQLSNCLRELARLKAEMLGKDGLDGALAFLGDAGRIADEARVAGFAAEGRALDPALAYEYGRVYAYAGAYEDALTALNRALDLLGEPAGQDGPAAEWAECVRLAGVVEGLYLKRPAPALARIDAAVGRLTALGHTEEAKALGPLASRLRAVE